ncbi:sugar efflux transporter [subsurface metagenome]
MPDALQIKLGESFTKSPTTGFLPLPHRRSILLLCVAIFFYWTALYLYVPILPVYAQSLGASLSLVGIIIASYALPQLLLRIPMGVWFDAMGKRKPLVAIGIVLTSVGALGLGLAPNVWLLFLSRVITGLGGAAWAILAVYFTAYYPQDNIDRPIGIIIFVNEVALVVATFCGGVIADVWGFKYTFLGAALLGIISLSALLLTREPTRRQVKAVSWRSFTQVATQPILLIVSSMGILLHFTNFAGVFGFIPIYGAKIGASSTDLGIITTLVLSSSAVAALITVHMVERWGNTFTIILGAALMGLALLAVPFIHHIYILEAVQVVNGFGRGVLRTILMTLSIRGVAPQQQATAMGIYQAIYAVGMLLGPLVSGFLADNQGLASVFYLSASLCLVIAGMACLPILPRR